MRRPAALLVVLVALLALASARVSVGPVGVAGALAQQDADTLAAASVGAPTELASIGSAATSVELALLEAANRDRVANGLPALDLDPTMLAVARDRAAAQLSTADLQHYTPDGKLVFVQLLSAAGVDYSLAGENLARAQGVDGNVVGRIEQALMQSPTHRKNILEPTFDRLAVGVAVDPSGRIAFAQIFRATR